MSKCRPPYRTSAQYRRLRQQNNIQNCVGLCSKCGIAPKVEGYSGYCRDCNKKKSREWKKQLKIVIMSWYGNECVCCGEKHLDFLTLDHINDDGKRERSGLSFAQALNSIGTRSGHLLYSRIKKLRYENRPKDLQILCFNCQWGKRLNNGFCPHQPERDLRIAAGIETLTKEQTV